MYLDYWRVNLQKVWYWHLGKPNVISSWLRFLTEWSFNNMNGYTCPDILCAYAFLVAFQGWIHFQNIKLSRDINGWIDSVHYWWLSSSHSWKIILVDVTEILKYRCFKYQEVNKIRVRAHSKDWEKRNVAVEIFQSNISFKNYSPLQKNNLKNNWKRRDAGNISNWLHILNSTSEAAIIPY